VESQRLQRDCELRLRDAMQGDLPPVCVWCGDAASQFRAVSLYHWCKRFVLRLPLCEVHKNDFRRRSLVLLASYVGFFLILTGGVVASACAEAGPPLSDIAFLAAAWAGGVGFLGLLGFFIYYLVLMALGIQIRWLGKGRVTLTRVAPEFAEALLVYGQEKRVWREHGVLPTDEVARVLAAANREAHGCGHDYLGSEHLLLGLWTAATPTAQVLRGLGIDPERVREEIRRSGRGQPGTTWPGSLPHTPVATRVLEHSAAAARALGGDSVNARHMLLGLLQERDAQGVQILVMLGLDPDAVRERVLHPPDSNTDDADGTD
jgi:ATP-dependent Clp protease ATP-binding subunit ClpC